jgi:hypothetical protein
MADDEKIHWWSWLILALHLLWSFTIIWLTKAEVFGAKVRWGAAIALGLGAAGLGAYDHFINKDTDNRDKGKFDPWTVVHTLAGVVFGLWYVPFIYVLITVFWWELFEFTVKGFGDKEVIINRGVDMGVAIVGWLIVVGIFGGAGVPLVTPVAS